MPEALTLEEVRTDPEKARMNKLRVMRLVAGGDFDEGEIFFMWEKGKLFKVEVVEGGEMVAEAVE